MKNSFHKQERLCSRKAIDQLFLKGFSCNSKPLKLMAIQATFDSNYPCQMMFVVPKKKFKQAHDRNLLKRRMREAYRLNKQSFYEALNAHGIKAHGAFIYNTSNECEFYEIEKAVKALLTQCVNKLKSSSQTKIID